VSTASLLRNTVRDQKDWKTVAFAQFQFFDPTPVPLGYGTDGKKLLVMPAEAKIVLRSLLSFSKSARSQFLLKS
jgi:hypothetical protein